MCHTKIKYTVYYLRIWCHHLCCRTFKLYAIRFIRDTSVCTCWPLQLCLTWRFKAWYVQKNRGGFDYYLQWPGFNIPSWVLDDARAGKLGSPLRPQVGRCWHQPSQKSTPDPAGHGFVMLCSTLHWRSLKEGVICLDLHGSFLASKEGQFTQHLHSLNHWLITSHQEDAFLRAVPTDAKYVIGSCEKDWKFTSVIRAM